MKWKMEILYSLLFFALAVGIFITGVVPYAQEILDRTALMPDQYVSTTGEVSHRDPVEDTATIRFFLEDGRETSSIIEDDGSISLGEEIEFSYRRDDPGTLIFPKFQMARLCLYMALTSLSVFTALMMRKPIQPHVPRPRRTLRERLEHY